MRVLPQSSRPIIPYMGIGNFSQIIEKMIFEIFIFSNFLGEKILIGDLEIFYQISKSLSLPLSSNPTATPIQPGPNPYPTPNPTPAQLDLSANPNNSNSLAT